MLKHNFGSARAGLVSFTLEVKQTLRRAMGILTPEMVRRFWVLVSETSGSHAPSTLEEWVELYRDHYGLSQLQSKALIAYIQSHLPLILDVALTDQTPLHFCQP